MLDTKTIITLVGLGAVISAISMFKKKKGEDKREKEERKVLQYNKEP